MGIRKKGSIFLNAGYGIFDVAADKRVQSCMKNVSGPSQLFYLSKINVITTPIFKTFQCFVLSVHDMRKMYQMSQVIYS